MVQVLICACARCSRALHGTFGWRVSARHATVLSHRFAYSYSHCYGRFGAHLCSALCDGTGTGLGVHTTRLLVQSMPSLARNSRCAVACRL